MSRSSTGVVPGPSSALPAPSDHAPGTGLHLSISDLPVNRIAETAGGRLGAGLEFLGMVRGHEGGRRIWGLRYSAYLPMARAELERIAGEGQARFGAHPLCIHHVVGDVPVGEASLAIRVSLPHSAEAFEACRWYLDAVKSRLPVWKEPRFL